MKNISELLKNCPKGTKLYSPLLGECEFKGIIQSEIFVEQEQRVIGFNKYGQYWDVKDSECLLFPSKDNRDWDNFCPFKDAFKDGDVLYIDCNDDETYELHQYIFILKQINEGHIDSYCYVNGTNKSKFEECWLADIEYIPRFATEEEKQKLFDAIKANGYKWNAETKTLEKLIKPKFKVGDIVVYKFDKKHNLYITNIEENRYLFRYSNGERNYFTIEDEEDYELAKFDISTLKPFDKVLVRSKHCNLNKWVAALYSNYLSDDKMFGVAGGLYYKNCIPFEGNEHLLGTTNDCDEYYKNW